MTVFRSSRRREDPEGARSNRARFRRWWRGGLLVAAVAVAMQAAPVARKPLDKTTFVVLGEGWAAGLADFALRREAQNRSFGAQIAAQMGAFFPQPLIESPGLGGVPGFPELPARLPGLYQTTVREAKPNLFVFNLSIPGSTVSESIRRRPLRPLVHQTDPQQTLINMVLGFPAMLLENDVPLWSQLEYARALRPTLVLVALGYADVLKAAVQADPDRLPEVASFSADYSLILAELKAAHAELIVMTVPDPLDTAYFSTLEEATRLVGAPAEILAALYELNPDDRISVPGLVKIANHITVGEIQPLPPGGVLEGATARSIRESVDRLNLEIVRHAATHDAVVYDLHKLVERFKHQGVTVGSRKLTAEFMGGLYSLSGSFPGQIAHALIANEVLDLMNRSYGTHFTPVNLEPLLSEDPAVLMSRGSGRTYSPEQLRQRFPQLRDSSPRGRTPSTRRPSP
jgi:hypothetical protein